MFEGFCPDAVPAEKPAVEPVASNTPSPTIEETPIAEAASSDLVSEVAESPLAEVSPEDVTVDDKVQTNDETRANDSPTEGDNTIAASDAKGDTDTPMAAESVAATSAPSPTPLLAAAARPDLGATAVRVKSSPRTGLACTSAGPITNEAEADRIFRRLTSEGLQTAVRETSRQSVESYIIVTPNAMPAVERKSMTSELKALGVDDFAVVYRGRYRHRISMGVYSQRPLAERRKAQLDLLGVDNVLEVRALSRRAWVVDVMAPRQDVAGINDLITDMAPKVAVAKSKLRIARRTKLISI